MKKLGCNLGILMLAMVFMSIFCGKVVAEPDIFVKDIGELGTGGKGYVPGEIIVKFKPGVRGEAIRRINSTHGASVLYTSPFAGFKRMRIPKSKTVEEMVAIYSRNPNIEYAEPNFIVQALMVPNDEYYFYQWHMDNPAYGGIYMEYAWDITTGDPNVIVAVIDTGVAYENYGKNYKLVPDLTETLFAPGYDFVNNDAHPNDDNGHGTHVTGTIAQSTNNNIGVAGVAFNTSIMPIKVLDKRGSGTYADVADGIYFAADNGAKVVNLSLGGDSPSITLEDAMAYAYNKGVTIVCASGNDGANTVSYPAAYDAYAIAVGAIRYDETRAYYSNGGPSLDLTAPGGDLNVDQNNDGYADGVLQQTFDRRPNNFGYWFYQGTSMACPHVAGVAALVIANGTSGPDQVREALESTAEDKGTSGWDGDYGWGIVDAYAALTYVSVPINDVAMTDVTAPTWALQGDSVSVEVTVANQGDFDETFTVTLTDNTDAVTIDSQSVSLPAAASATLTFGWDTVDATIGDHILEAVASVVEGETNTNNNSLTSIVAIKEPVHDVAIAAVDAPLEAISGDIIPVDITVENQGAFSETTTVSLTDTTDGIEIGSQSVTLAARATEIITFNWDTATASIGDHTLEATASQVTGETDTADNSMAITITVKEQALVDVAILKVDAKDIRSGASYNIKAQIKNPGATSVSITARCVVYDQAGTTIEDNTLTDKTATIDAGGTVNVLWKDTCLLPKGTYLAKVTVLEEPGEERSDPFKVK